MTPRHPIFTRRTAIRAGAIGLLGIGIDHLPELRAAAVREGGDAARGEAKACIYIFLSGGLAQHDSFDLKPDAPAEIRGEFRPIATGLYHGDPIAGLLRRAPRGAPWPVGPELVYAVSQPLR